MKQPISIIIPCFNGQAYLREAMESIAAQDWPFEIVCIDDGSTDDSAKIIKEEYPYVQYHYQANSSPAAARNKGIALASYDIIGFLDVDDRWTQEKTKEQMRVFRQNTEVDVVGGLIDYQIMPESQYRGSLYAAAPVEHTLVSSILVKKSVFDTIGYFDESLRLLYNPWSKRS